MDSVEIDAGDVMRVILQFCKENGLNESLKTLQDETQISLNTVDNIQELLENVNEGNWDKVLNAIELLRLPISFMEDLYEEIILELIEAGELDTAKSIIKSGNLESNNVEYSKMDFSAIKINGPILSLRINKPDRYLRLEKLVQQNSFDSFEGYRGISREKRRAKLASFLSETLVIAPPSRLMNIISQSLKYQESQGFIPPGDKFDLFRGVRPSKILENETWPDGLEKTIKFGSKSHAECAIFTPDGNYLVTGSSDGFIEVWNWSNGKLVKDALKYQANDQYMTHETCVLALCFSDDSENLASGSEDGKIKVWQLKTGKCLAKYEAAHTEGITCLCFTKDGGQILSGSLDSTIKLHGLKSGKTLKIFRGHKSYVNNVSFSHDGSKVFSSSSDATVKVWDSRTSECLVTFAPSQSPVLMPDGTSRKQEQSMKDFAVNSVSIFPKKPDHILVCNRSPTLLVMNMKGQIVRQFETDKGKNGSEFINFCVSPKGEFIYAAAEDSYVYCFNATTGVVEHTYKAHQKGIIGLAHHPQMNLLATFNEEGELNLWK